MMLPTFVSLVTLLRNSEFVTNTVSVTLVPLVLLNKLPGSVSDPEASSLVKVLISKALSSIRCIVILISPRTAVTLSPVNWSGFISWTDTANVVSETKVEDSSSAIGMLSDTLSRAPSSLKKRRSASHLSHQYRLTLKSCLLTSD